MLLLPNTYHYHTILQKDKSFVDPEDEHIRDDAEEEESEDSDDEEQQGNRRRRPYYGSRETSEQIEEKNDVIRHNNIQKVIFY